MKIRVKDEAVIKHGKVNLPDIGTVDVPEDGVLDVHEDLGNMLITAAPDAWAKHHFQGGKTSKQIEWSPKAQPAVESAAESNEPEEIEDNPQDNDEVKARRKELLQKPFESLRDICAALQFPQEEYENLKKSQLVNYILNKSEEE